MSKVNYTRTIATYSARVGVFDVVTVAPARFLAIDGQGDPNISPDYAGAVATLYPVAYALKFFSKNELGRDFAVMPLEAQWWAPDMDVFTARRDKSRWSWTVMILHPDWLTAEHLAAATASVSRRRELPRISELRLEEIDEGLCVQTLHRGPYDDEGPVLASMHIEGIAARGLTMRGRHHEIYLNDPRRTRPESLRTILRQPVTTPSV